MIKQSLWAMGILAVFITIPFGQSPQATMSNDVYYNSYPIPMAKPYNLCSLKSGGINDPHINQKQAMVAALGLYLGVKKASPPTPEQRQQTCI